MNKIKRNGKAKLREEYFIKEGHYPLDNLKAYSNWLEEKLVKNLALSDVVKSLPNKEEIDSDIEKIALQNIIDCKGIYTSKKLHREIYKLGFNKGK